MQSDKVLIELKELAEKIGIKVTEQVLKSPGIHVRSGLCKVEGKDRFILDKKLKLGDKVELLADCLCLQDTSGVFLIPQIRDLLAKQKKRADAKRNEDATSTDSITEDGEESSEQQDDVGLNKGEEPTIPPDHDQTGPADEMVE